MIIGPRLTMGEYNTRCLAEARGKIVVLVNDAMVVRTHSWDERLRALDAEYENRLYLAYGNDLFKGEKLCTFLILSRRTCELLIDPFPAEYRGAFIDYYLLDIFKRLEVLGEMRIRYFASVVFEHLHYRAGKAQIDTTYTQRNRFADDRDFLALSGSLSGGSAPVLRFSSLPFRWRSFLSFWFFKGNLQLAGCYGL